MGAALMWLIGAGVLVGIEILTLDLTFAILAAAALGAGGTAALGGPFWLQGLVGVGIAGIGIAFVRPIAIRHLRSSNPEMLSGVDALPGQRGKALTEITQDSGRMNLRGEVWSARLDPDVTSVPVPEGTPLTVTRIDGATALVHPID
jgi:membrane protein implicated in regulation of membrane protease activity